eukprot:gene9635-20027_t
MTQRSSVLVLIVAVLNMNNCMALKIFAPSKRLSVPMKLECTGTSYVDSLLPLIKKNTAEGSVVVIKYGGHAMENDELKKFFCEDIAALCKIGIFPVVVHGGGPQIAKMLTSLSIESKFVQGLRVTDSKTMEVAQMVLCGSINKEIVSLISSQPGIRGAIGLCGLDSNLIKADIVRKTIIEDGVEKVLDFGLVGDPSIVNTELLQDLINLKLVPVIAPVGSGENGRSLNINADTAAGAVAEALKADRLLLLTDVTGVLDKNKQLIEVITTTSLPTLIADGTITGGMIPKLETATESVVKGVGTVSIMDGRVRHCVLKALSGETFGTRINKFEIVCQLVGDFAFESHITGRSSITDGYVSDQLEMVMDLN